MNTPHPWFKVEGRLPIQGQNFRIRVYLDPDTGREHLALILGPVRDGENLLVRVHSECITGDLFGSQKCDCGPQLDMALSEIIDTGKGIVIYLRQEGRGIGLIEKIRAYNLQEKGLDTVEANEALGHQADSRDFGLAAEILKELGVTSISLITNNPSKLDGLANCGIKITDRISHQINVNSSNRRYLETKASKLKHLITLD